MKFSPMLLVLVLGIAGCVQYGQQPTATPAATNVIEITASGFNPSSLTIKAGETVTWLNNGNAPTWPASAVHPTHRVYPGSDITKCGTGETIFDACKGLANGESFSFTFNNKGTWGYHDHLNPSLFGKIVVE